MSLTAKDVADSPGSHVVEIYAKTFCWYCRAARRLLDAKGVQYHEINLGKEPARRVEMIERSLAATVPQIFIHGQCIGGYDELKALEEKGLLDPMLKVG
ncbi:MAG: glutaredoxin 3 [Deltaproteobacteria bacterium]|nr:glutaredoxin 3 [Deltaproteobacteria bacterium]